MNQELLALVLKKARVPSRIKLGLSLSIMVFEIFDINGRVKRARG